MASQGKARFLLAIAATLALVACEDGKPPFGTATSSEAGFATAPRSAKAAPAMDVEAPDVFALSGEGLWDGRPSLGGVWVAHSSVTDPERVMIRNPTNGKSVVGALFRRERENPGPSLQVSSDAAEALGMLAGQPADLSVVALRREEPQTEPAAAEPAPELAPELATADATDTAAGPAPTGAASADKPADAAVAEAMETSAAPEKPARKQGGFFGLFRKKPKPDPTAIAPVATGVASGAIEQGPLDPIAGAAAAIDRAEGTPPVAPVAAPALKRAYVQIGIFSTNANADRAGSQMKAAGLTATILPEESQGKTYWRVIVGPAASVAERKVLASRVKDIGYPDAYPVTK